MADEDIGVNWFAPGADRDGGDTGDAWDAGGGEGVGNRGILSLFLRRRWDPVCRSGTGMPIGAIVTDAAVMVPPPRRQFGGCAW